MRNAKGFSLVEVTLAIGIAGFALLAIFGLLPVGLSSNQASIQQTEAANIVTGIVADLRQVPNATAIASNPSLSSVSPKYGIDAAGAGSTIFLDESGALESTAAQARYKAVAQLTQPSAGQRTATYGSVIISWPAAATNPSGTVKSFLALDRN
ncbi:MAG: prepilin-type N-terminal cleavage/methylation domain-containing protein [Verrucomicrobiota bacterium]